MWWLTSLGPFHLAEETSASEDTSALRAGDNNSETGKWQASD